MPGSAIRQANIKVCTGKSKGKSMGKELETAAKTANNKKVKK